MDLPESAPSNKLKTWLFNPFYYIAGGVALGVGLAVMVIAGLVGAATNYHFDGVIDLHSGTPAPAWVFVAENLINWLVMGVLVYLAGRLTSRSRSARWMCSARRHWRARRWRSPCSACSSPVSGALQTTWPDS